MANEISVSMVVQVNKGNLRKQLGSNLGMVTVDQAGVGGPAPGYVTVGTTEEQITLTEISSLGWAMFTNLDDTNFVEWGFATGVYGGKLMPGESAAFRMNPGADLFMVADTGACKCLVEVLEA